MVKNKGSALLTALFIMTLVAIVATAMSMRLQIDIYRTRLVTSQDQMYLASQAVTFWAMGALRNPKHEFRIATPKGRVAKYPDNLVNLIPQITIHGALYDLQARFNLNNLTDKRSIPNFLFILDQIAPNMKTVDKFNLITAISSWISPYDLGRGKDSHMDYYLAQKPPYLPANQMMYSSSELRLVKDVTPDMLLSLEPFVTALPKATPININTASSVVLRSLGNGLKENQANDLITARGTEGIKELKEIQELMKKLGISSDQLTTQSEFFMSVADIQYNEFHQIVTTILKRERDKKDGIIVSIVGEFSQSF